MQSLTQLQVKTLLADVEKSVKGQFNVELITYGWELEFYLSKPPSQHLLKGIASIPFVHEIKPEKGVLQYEVSTTVFSSVVMACGAMSHIRDSILVLAQLDGNRAIFDATVSMDSQPSSMQLSFGFCQNGTFLSKNQLLPIVNNILDSIHTIIHIACPTQNCLERIYNTQYTIQFKNSPTHATWGVENRTVAIRVTSVGFCREISQSSIQNLSHSFTNTSNTNSQQITGERLEFRVASPVANPYYLASVLLASILVPSMALYPQTFTNSIHSDAKRLPSNILEVEKLFLSSNVWKRIQGYV